MLQKAFSRVLKYFVSFVKKFIIPTKCKIVLYGNKQHLIWIPWAEIPEKRKNLGIGVGFVRFTKI